MTASPTTVVELLRRTADAHADRLAFVDGDRRMTFAGLERAAAGVAASFADLGVGKGDVVCLMLPSSIDYAVCYHAAMRLGAVASGINLRLGPTEVDSIVGRTRPRVTVCDAGVTPPDGAGRVVSRADAVAAFDGPPLDHPPAVDASDPVTVVWTSGTTGRPKGAVFDHDNLAAMARGAYPISQPGDVRLSPLPFAHVGFMTRAWDELANAITTVIVPTPWKAGTALRLIQDEGVTVGQGVPTQWSLMIAHPDVECTDRASLRVCAIGGASVAPELVRAMRRTFACPVVVRYASTEASIISGTTIGEDDEIVARTVGTAVDGVEVEVVDDDGRRLPPGQVGRIRCRSAAVMRRYWDDAERTAEVLDADGWLTTGDLGWTDEHGNLTLVGRRAEMYIRGGYNVYPSEVEAVLSEHPCVARVAVVGIPDTVLGERGAAFVVPEPGGALDADDLRHWCRARLADYKAPDVVRIVDDLPLTSMLKVDKRALVDLVEQEVT